MPDITLAELNKKNLELAKTDRNLAFSTYPELLYPILLKPCTVRMLMVTDAGGSFTDADFGLTELIDVLSVSPGPYVRFAVTKAHRSAVASNADILSFKFDTTDLTKFDQIWMIAVGRTGIGLSQSELKAIATFMDSGGGVFATGDHEILGVDMCGGVPRVRSMRKWHWPNPGPNGEPIAPAVDGATHLDTNQVGHDASLTFDDQSDDVPQQVSPVMHSIWSPHFFVRRRAPHPLLCGPKGILRYLPDHPHEGECYVPSDLTKTFTFSGYTTTEYPILSGTTRLEPEIVARGQSGGPGIGTKSTPANRTFGSIGAYDGHRVNVGRVVVQSTWHHLFNINLKGVPGNADPVKRHGFYATPQGLAKYEDIKAYFRNIAVWLAPPASQSCMRWRALWATRWDSRLFMDLRPYKNLAEVDLEEFVRVGGVARDVLGRYATQCTSYHWVLDWLKMVKLRFPFEILEPQVDPRPSDPFVYYYTNLLADASLGALVYALAEKYPEATEEARKFAGKSVDEELMLLAAKTAEASVIRAARESLSQFGRFMQ